jgi:capsular exopolysaccharide synthesis family protein
MENITDNLDVSIDNKQSTIIDLSLKDENSERGEAILNDLIKFYNVSIEMEKNQLAANTAKFIDDRLATVENELLQIEHEQQTYRSNRGAIDVGTQGKLYLENVSSNDQKQGDINMQLSVLKQVENYVHSKSLSNGIVPSTVGVSDPGLNEMVKNIYELQLQRESLKKTTGENNPAVLSLNDQIEKIRPQILENLQNQRQSLEASRKNIVATNQNYSSQLQSIPETEKKLVDISRELSLKSDIYTFLLQKKEETALSFITNGSSSKIVNRPESSEFPVTPKRKMIYLGSLFLSVLVGLGFSTTRESLRSKIMYQVDIEKLTALPVISEITSGQSDKVIVIGNNQRTLIAEQFRRLRVTLSYLGIGDTKKRILITSAISGEGKSFVAINLAMSLALTDKKVALLDFDLNNPSLHLKFKINKGIGITEYLRGDVNAEAIINRSAVNENLYFISAGEIPDNPSELITNGKTEDLLGYLDGKFDFVIVDVAPVGPISDAYILSPLCDATLYIIRHAYTPKVFVERIDKNNLLNNLKNAAIVFNDVSSRNFSNYSYGYGYGNVYGGKNDRKRLD